MMRVLLMDYLAHITDDLDIGRPIALEALMTDHTYVMYSAQSLGLSDDLLPVGMANACAAAKALRIDDIRDVREVFLAFRYMSWLHILLLALRRPLPTYVYRMLLQTGQNLHYTDERVLKSFSTIVSRAR
jgi:hypothetical protein